MVRTRNVSKQSFRNNPGSGSLRSVCVCVCVQAVLDGVPLTEGGGQVLIGAAPWNTHQGALHGVPLTGWQAPRDEVKLSSPWARRLKHSMMCGKNVSACSRDFWRDTCKGPAWGQPKWAARLSQDLGVLSHQLKNLNEESPFSRF